jgi:hypothetical protein
LSSRKKKAAQTAARSLDEEDEDFSDRLATLVYLRLTNESKVIRDLARVSYRVRQPWELMRIDSIAAALYNTLELGA